MQSATLAMDEMSSFVHSFVHSTTASQLLLYARCLLATGRTAANSTARPRSSGAYSLVGEAERKQQSSVHVWSRASPLLDVVKKVLAPEGF